jgi:hypothetical protein
MSQNPQLNASNYILNIVELQNTITNITGLTPVAVLSNQVQTIAEMVDVERKKINVNFIAKFNQTPIQVLDDINLSNVNLYQNGNLVVGAGASAGGGATLAQGSTGITVVSTPTTPGGPLISFDTVNGTIITINADNTANYTGGTKFVISSPSVLQIGTNAAPGKTLNCLDHEGTAEWGYVSTLATAGTIRFLGATKEFGRFTSPQGYLGIGNSNPLNALDVNGDGVFTGRVSAFDFLTLSDRRFKTDITTISNASEILSNIRGVRFMWRDLSFNDVGVIAQEVAERLPEAVNGTEVSSLKLSVAYHKIIPVLVEVVKELEGRVKSLERELLRRGS